MNLLDLLFPAKCPICGQILKRNERGVCNICRKALPRVTEPVCSRCGKPLEADTEEYCLDCSKKRESDYIEDRARYKYAAKSDPICRGTALWVYTDTMKRVMADFKYHGHYRMSAFLADELVRFRGVQICQWQPDYVIPVPLHRRRKWFRGFNQAVCVAEEIGKRLHIPVISVALERWYYTRPQKNLENQDRRENVKDAFRVSERWREKLCGKCILLVDDIYTTGATLESCASVLCEAGVKKVYFVCLCIGRDY